MRRALLGINAARWWAFLLAALFQPVWQRQASAEVLSSAWRWWRFVLLLVSWRQPAWRVVLFCAGVGGLTLA